MPSDKEWLKINKDKQNSINEAMDRKERNIDVLACMHDAVQITLMEYKNDTSMEEGRIEDRIAYWLHTLREIADNEKKPQPITTEQIRKTNEDFDKKMAITSECDDAEREIKQGEELK